MPVYRCWNPEHENEGEGWDVDTYDAYRAASRFAELYDKCDGDRPYATHGGTVCVRLSTIAVTRFSVTGESTIVYRAQPAANVLSNRPHRP